MFGELTRKSNDFGYSTQTIIDQIQWFDPYRHADYENAPNGNIGHLLMTRPSLNLSSSNIDILRKSPRMSYFFNSPVARSLLWSLSSDSTSRWLPIIYKRGKSYSVTDYEIKAAEKGGTYFGHTVRYGFHNEECKQGGTLSIEFSNDKEFSILWMMYMWSVYIALCTYDRLFQPLDYYQKYGILDYAASLYYIVTDISGRKIKYFEKLVGVFPTRVPLSMFNWNNEVFTQDTVSIDFNYAYRSDPMDYEVLVDIMHASGFLNSGTTQTTLNTKDIFNIGALDGTQTAFASSDRLLANPIIYRKDNRNGGYDFNLAFTNAGIGNPGGKTGSSIFGNLPSGELVAN